MKRLLIFVAASLLLVAPVQAQSSRSGGPPTFPPQQIVGFAKKVEKDLAARGAHVALVARLGRDPREMPKGIDYTHVGLWVYSQITTTDGRRLPGYAVHNLYQLDDNLDRSELVMDYPADFFSQVYTLKAGVLVPKPEVQARLVEVLASPTYSKLHIPSYSVVANPHRLEFQNCTGFLAQLLTAAVYRTDDVRQIQANVRAYFQPDLIEISPMERLLGQIFMKGVAVSDHDGEIRTATFGSLVRYLQKYDLAAASYELKAD